MGDLKSSPRCTARLAGAFQLLEGFASPVGQVVILGKIVVAGSASATAANILAQEQIYRFGFALCLFAVPLHVVWALLMYELLKPVSARIAALSAFIIVIGCAVQAVSSVFYLAPLMILKSASAFNGFTAEQMQSLAFACVKLNGATYDSYLVLFGIWCVLIGHLILRSMFLPRILGALLILDGFGWMLYLWPPLAKQFFTIIAVAAGVAEFPLELWLLIFAVNARRWHEQAQLSAASA